VMMQDIFQLLSGFGIAGRISISALLILPLGFFMGMPFPKGTLRLGSLIDWGFAVNGAASVLGSALCMLIAFAYGFSAALTLALCLYMMAYVVMMSGKSWTPASTLGEK